ncbi:hypothetical protein AB1Y20_009736 [Prymnesium parvum]|uniref:Large ribosomal subunit protein bL34m n=1 Tax=Prymnesium parvum TaxID=97485 RepID=A0AB34K5Y4_PRYPA
MWRRALRTGLRGALRPSLTRRISDMGGRVPAASDITLHFSPRLSEHSLSPLSHIWWPDVGSDPLSQPETVMDVQVPLHTIVGVPVHLEFDFDLPSATDAGFAIHAKKGKRTYQPNVLQRKRKHGYLKRMRTKGGFKVLTRRKLKGRRRLAVT